MEQNNPPIVDSSFQILSLKSKSDFIGLRSNSKFLKFRLISCVFKETSNLSCRIGFSFSKKKAIAVDRNKLRRVIREYLRQRNDISVSFDALFILNVNLKKLSKTEKQKLIVDLYNILEQLSMKFCVNYKGRQ